MTTASMPYDNPLFNWLRSIQWILSSERPLKVSGPFGDFEVEYHIDTDPSDDEHSEYASIGFMLPDDDMIFAEIDGGTYGVLQGIRIYLDTPS